MALSGWGVAGAVTLASLDAIIITDNAGEVLEFNPAAERMFGYQRDKAIGRKIGELIVPDHHRSAHDAGMTRYNSGQKARVLGRRLEMEAKRADGTIFPVELAITEAESNGQKFFAASLRDLTERHAAEAERRASEALLSALIDDQTELVIRSDATYHIVICNEAVSRFFGVPRSELIGQRFTPGTPPEVAHRLLTELPLLTPDKSMRRSIDPKIMPNGETRWLDWSNRALFDEHGRLTGHLSVARDITEERLANEVLERTNRENALYRRMFNAMPDSVYAKDREGRFIAVNEAMARAMAIGSTDEMIGTSDLDWHPPEVAATYGKAEAEFYASGAESTILTQRIWQPDGTESWQVTRKALFRDEDGRIIGLIGHGRDVTEQVKAERALAASEARFAAFAENAPVAMFIKDDQGRYVMLNGEAAKVIGGSRESIIGKTAREVGTAPSADATEAADRKLRETGKPLRTIGKLAAEGDPYHWAMVLRFPMDAPSGEGMWIGGFAIDVTSQHETEKDLERSREALHQSEKLNAMGSLLAGVAHELNNPLAIVVAHATMLEEDAAGGPMANRAEKIRRAADRCGKIVQTFLGLARRKPAERQPVRMNDLVTAAIDLMAYPLRTAGIDVSLDLAADLPMVEGDPDMLNQVFLNLLVNAQQALEGREGQRAIRITTTQIGPNLVAELSDSGDGVPRDIRTRIFEPFFSTKPQGVGTGVGLSFCHSVVAAHQGRLELLSPGEGLAGLPGATFRVTLPISEPGPGQLTAEPEAPETVVGRALVVDDEIELAEVLAEMLHSGGYLTDIAGSAAEAQEFVRSRTYDVILSDLRMPGMDGPALFGWLQAERPDMASRVAFVTGDALGASASAFLARSGRPVLEKPFSLSGVLRVASEAQGKASGPDEPQGRKS
jgi:PAS domain S-box-containing protein